MTGKGVKYVVPRLTAPEDRQFLRWFWTAIAVLVFLAVLQGLARADPDDGGSMYGERTASLATEAYAKQSRNSVSLSGIVAPLADKAREIVSACGSKVVSSVRVGARVYGGSPSNHASGRAVDLQGNPSCIYAQLRGWPGGVSTDYWRAPGGPHVHVSYSPNGMEWGIRFVHRGSSRKARHR